MNFAVVDVGQPAPRFTLPDGEFRPFPPKACLGRPVLLAFFPAVFSPPCTAELLDLQGRLPARQHGIAFPLLGDFHRETIRAYEVEDTDFLGLRGVAEKPQAEPDYEEILRAVERLSTSREGL